MQLSSAYKSLKKNLRASQEVHFMLTEIFSVLDIFLAGLWNDGGWHLDSLKYTVDVWNGMHKKKHWLWQGRTFNNIDICKTFFIFPIEINSLNQVKQIKSNISTWGILKQKAY